MFVQADNDAIGIRIYLYSSHFIKYLLKKGHHVRIYIGGMFDSH